MLEHGINAVKDGTNFAAVTSAKSGIPCFIGAWPCHAAQGYIGEPQLILNYDEAVKVGGYSDEWRNADGTPKWNLCQAIYAHFRLAGMSPAIFINVFDPAVNKKIASREKCAVVDHRVVIADGIKDSSLEVEVDAEVANTLTEGVDYEAYYVNSALTIELIEGSAAYNIASLTISYNKADLTSITADTIETAIEKVERCKNLLGVVPDLLCAPGWSQTPAVAALLAVKAANINGLYKAKAVVDLDTSEDAADTYDKVAAYKTENGYTDDNQIVCWPLLKANGYVFDYSVVLCGAMASIDEGNDNCPYESPSNKLIGISGACNAANKDISLSVPEANTVCNAGVVTALNFNGWRTWGNYTACWPTETDVAKYFICTSRVQDWICNSFINAFWSYIDRPMTHVLIDAVVDSFNLWLAGLRSAGILHDGEIRYVADNNNTSQFIGGRFRLDTHSASPTPAQRIDMHAEFDVDMLVSALNNNA